MNEGSEEKRDQRESNPRPHGVVPCVLPLSHAGGIEGAEGDELNERKRASAFPVSLAHGKS